MVGHLLNKSANAICKALQKLENMKNASRFFEGAEYSPKVLSQMSKGAGEMHSFPEEVTAFRTDGTVKNIVGADGKNYAKLTIPGKYNGKTGNFEFIKDENGIINHRFFKVDGE